MSNEVKPDQTVAAPAPASAPSAAGLNALAQDAELLSDFIFESREHLASIENHALALEQDPENSESIHSMFRAFHTIKGLAGFLELRAMHEVSHEVETVLDLARNGKLQISAGVIDVVLESADFLKEWIEHLDGVLHGRPSLAVRDNAALLARIRKLPAASEQPAISEDLSQLSRAVEGAPAESDPASAPQEPENVGRSQTVQTGASTVKVDTAKLDYLVDMAGEMVVAQSLVRHDPDLAGVKTPRLTRNLAQLSRITAEIQKTSMSMRLVPIAQLFHRMARLVRDLSRKSGKAVELEMSGEDTELDRTIVEELADPFMHMVRNAIDHGVEAPEARLASGKSPTARIRLKACHQAGHIMVEICDDGRGLDKQKILAKAVQKGLVANPEHLSETEIFNLILEPGFSTAEKVTDLSGRGVGMDVVRKQIQKLRGRIEIRSSAGVGTTIILKLPLTLAIIDGLVVGVGAERYIVPLFAVCETFRPLPEAISSVRNRDEMVTAHGVLLPMIRLYKRLGVKARVEDPCQGVLVAIESDTNRFCLMVDELIGKQEVVIKSLGETFKNVPGIAGGAILGDGRVGLILELDGIFRGRQDE